MHSRTAPSDSASAAGSAALRDLPELWTPEDVVDRIERALVAERKTTSVEDEVIDLTTAATQLEDLVGAQYRAPRRRSTA